MKSFNRCLVLSTVGALASVLTACGGGGGGGGGYSSGSGGGGGGGGGGSTYTIAGNVTGLAGSGLVLVNNGADALAVQPSSGSFKFATALASGKAYSVSVQTQPSGQSCSVGNASGTMPSANVTNVAVSCAFAVSGSNQVAISVNPGPASAGNQTFNDLLVSVKVCVPGTNTCTTVTNVLVDTESSGLRVMKSVLTAASLTLTPVPDPNQAGNTFFECLQFADGFAWGTVATADVKISGESAASIPVQIIDDSGTTPPNSCNVGKSVDSVDALDANGVLGVSGFVQDCGSACVNTAGNNIYYSCNTSCALTATSSTIPLADQVANPVASFTTDNNGVIVQLPTVPATGAATANGALVFGISTASDNNLGAVTILTTNSLGYFATTFNGQMLANSFIDSGSNALFFPAGSNSPLTVCADANQFYCPGSSSSISTQNLNATSQGANGTMSNVQFPIANLDYLSANAGSNYALNNVGGPAVNSPTLSNYFDWGLPFLYGRTVYVAIEGKAAAGTTGPYFAY